MAVTLLKSIIDPEIFHRLTRLSRKESRFEMEPGYPLAFVERERDAYSYRCYASDTFPTFSGSLNPRGIDRRALLAADSRREKKRKREREKERKKSADLSIDSKEKLGTRLALRSDRSIDRSIAWNGIAKARGSSSLATASLTTRRENA